MPINAATAYQNNKVSTASPAELTLMLYDGAIKYCNIAIIGVEEKDINKSNTNIIKTEKIIDYLRSTLDFKYSVAEDFDKVYEYINERLITANINKDKAILEEILGYLRDMRDTWKEVMKHAK
ncbi:flagellar export chaperone FliS [Anaerocolumna sp. MB42-C2]|uniref:flagellar export chaperone FliS n=1 Tax=Anaerocolumna sp. MB42-C2 TaxID=3070997 RepID=UPI0027E00A53|nr:flagellar export chaperone FliS [Anaerocolumna sp. MB42-C2]WMJ90230.1 flagellar export chaperone FliS [Anaerocolumna sp. MB42-C2]